VTVNTDAPNAAADALTAIGRYCAGGELRGRRRELINYLN
jgi:hypothetical protein